jgi:Integrase core domain
MKKSPVREQMTPTWSGGVLSKVHVDIFVMPAAGQDFKYIVNARDDFSGFVDGRAIRDKSASQVAHFLKEFIGRFGIPWVIVADNGEVDSETVKELLKSYGIQVRFTSPYHPQGNSVVERGHQTLKRNLALWSKQTGKRWINGLPLAFLADNMSIRRSTGFTPFELMFGRLPVLPCEFDVRSWAVVDWNQVRTREELLMARLFQLTAWEEGTLQLAAKNLRKSRLAGKQAYDQRHKIRSKPLGKGDMVLMRHQASPYSGKNILDPRYAGPYKIVSAVGNGTYCIAELDGSQFHRPVHGDRLKIFTPRDGTAGTQ